LSGVALALAWVLFSCVLFYEERGGLPFIGGEEGVIWNMPHPLMEGANHPQNTLNLAVHL
jgi:hypothetical protein